MQLAGNNEKLALAIGIAIYLEIFVPIRVILPSELELNYFGMETSGKISGSWEFGVSGLTKIHNTETPTLSI